METKNLIIKKSEWKDLSDFCLWERKPEVTEFFSIRDEQPDEDVFRKFVEDDNDPKAQQFTIWMKTAEEPVRIGRIVLADVEEGFKAELWRIYIADEKLRCKGYGKEAMLAVMKYCFEELGLERLYLDHYTGNPAAGLYISLGFKYEGVLRSNCRKNGKLYDVHLMSMLKSEYEAIYCSNQQ